MRIIYMTREGSHYLNSVCCYQMQQMRERGEQNSEEYKACSEYVSDYAIACTNRERQPDDD